MYDWGAHAPRVLATPKAFTIADFSLAKSLSNVVRCPRDFGGGAEMSRRGACAPQKFE